METTAGNIILATLIGTAIITGCFFILAPFVPVNEIQYAELNHTYAKFNEMNAKTQDITNVIQKVKPADDPLSKLLGIANSFLNLCYGAITQIWGSITILTNIILDSGSNFLHLPTWLTGLLITSLLVMIAFAIMAAYFRWRM